MTDNQENEQVNPFRPATPPDGIHMRPATPPEGVQTRPAPPREGDRTHQAGYIFGVQEESDAQQ